MFLPEEWRYTDRVDANQKEAKCMQHKLIMLMYYWNSLQYCHED